MPFLKVPAIIFVSVFLISCSSTVENRDVASQENNDDLLKEYIDSQTVKINLNHASQANDELSFNEMEFQDNLRVAELRIKGAEERIIVLGSDQSKNINSRFRANLYNLGFSDKPKNGLKLPLNNDLSAVDVKFLITLEKNQVRSIRSFEIGGPNKFLSVLKKIFTGRGAAQRAGLPPELVDVSKARTQLAVDEGIDLLIQYGITPVSTGFAPIIGALRKQTNERKSFYANYLDTVISSFLKDDNQVQKFPLLGEFLSRDQVEDMGCALHIDTIDLVKSLGLLLVLKTKSNSVDLTMLFNRVSFTTTKICWLT